MPFFLHYSKLLVVESQVCQACLPQEPLASLQVWQAYQACLQDQWQAAFLALPEVTQACHRPQPHNRLRLPQRPPLQQLQELVVLAFMPFYNSNRTDLMGSGQVLLWACLRQLVIATLTKSPQFLQWMSDSSIRLQPPRIMHPKDPPVYPIGKNP